MICDNKSKRIESNKWIKLYTYLWNKLILYFKPNNVESSSLFHQTESSSIIELLLVNIYLFHYFKLVNISSFFSCNWRDIHIMNRNILNENIIKHLIELYCVICIDLLYIIFHLIILLDQVNFMMLE